MSDMPDFDSMSPEEMMRWMETLAKRQGADEGLTTDADLEIDEISEDDERLAGQGDYIPYGWTQEQWEAQLEKEAQQKAEKAARQQQPPAAPAPPPVPEPEPEPEPVQPAASADAGTPDFDSMSPEEMMRWMESLAKRQGADEGLTTDADLEIDEISEDDERLAGQGDYIPYGWTQEQWEAQLEKEAQQKAEKAARQQQPPAEVDVEDELFDEDEGEEDFLEALSGDVLQPPSLDELFGAAQEDDNILPEFDADITSMPTDRAPAQPAEPATQNPMDWLTGLMGQEEENAGELDFDMDALGNLEGLAAADDSGDSMSWLADLAGGGDSAPQQEDTPDEGSLEWQEALARRQGANTQELITGGYADAPEAEDTSERDPGYQPFSFEEGTGGTLQGADEPGEQLDFASLGEGEPEDWLNELANVSEESDSDELFGLDFSEGSVIAEAEDADDEYDDVTSSVVEKMNRGEVSPEEIANFFDAQFKRAETRTDVPDYIEGEEDLIPPAIEAEIPDWLQETMAESAADTADTDEEPSATSTAEMMIAGLDLGDDTEAEDQIPDWLQEDIAEDTGDIEEDIFAEEDFEAEFEADTLLLDSVTDDEQDTWEQAFAAEQSGKLDTWYEQALQEVSDDILDDLPEDEPAGELLSADLPAEDHLPKGQPQALPAWMTGDETSTIAEVPAIEEEDLSWLADDDTTSDDLDDEEMPAWLRQQVDEPAEEDVPDWVQQAGLSDIPLEEIPEWLRETMDEEEDAVASQEAAAIMEEEPARPEPEPAPEPAAPVPAIPQRSPAPVPATAVKIDVAAFLQRARQKVSGGDVDGGLQEFEQVVRSNQALDEVEQEVKQLVESGEKKNPAAHRVLGDVLMRQGKLQEALDTYRKALNML